MALTEKEHICDEELLLRGLPFFTRPEPKYFDKGALTSLVFRDPDYKPSVHMGSHANFAALVEDELMWFGFAVLSAGDVRRNNLGAVEHDPNKHYSHSLIIAPPNIKKDKQEKRWRAALLTKVWDIIFIPHRVEQFR